jgi:hypothetical protein
MFVHCFDFEYKTQLFDQSQDNANLSAIDNPLHMIKYRIPFLAQIETASFKELARLKKRDKSLKI